MFNWLFKKVKKEEFEHHKSAVQTALNSVKHDMDHVSKWIKHLDNTDSNIKNDVEQIMKEMATIRDEVLEIREMLETEKPVKVEPIFKQRQTAVVKQTAVEHVQTAVQTAVQAGFFTKLSTSERAIVGILMNTDMKLSYEDLAAMMGKDTATVRGQVNSIKQKCEGIIEEQVEKTGKKRLFVPEKVKEILLKSVKVRKKKEKSEENEEN